MEVSTAQAIVRTQCDTQDVTVPLRQCLESEADGLLRTIRIYVMKGRLAATDIEIESVALEVLSQTTIEALKLSSRFNPALSARPWLQGIAAKVVQRMRRERLRLRQEIPASAWRPPDDVDEEGDDDLFERIEGFLTASPEDSVLASEGAEALLALVSSEDRQVLELAIIEDLNSAQLGQRLGITSGAARVRLLRARTRLHEAYRQKEARNGQA